MQCNGKCYLAKKLKQQEKQDQQAPVSKNEKFDIAPFFVPEPVSIIKSFSIIKAIFFTKDAVLVYSAPRSIFHPPSA